MKDNAVTTKLIYKYPLRLNLETTEFQHINITESLALSVLNKHIAGFDFVGAFIANRGITFSILFY
jgi:hypothetical protein